MTCRYQRFPWSLLLSLVGFMLSAPIAAAMGAAAQDPPSTEQPGIDINAFIENLGPLSVEEVVRSLEPIPSLEECLAPLPDDPEAPWRLVLAGESKMRTAKIEKQVVDLRMKGAYEEALPAAKVLLEIHRQVQGEAHWQVRDAKWLVETLQELSRLPDRARSEIAEAERFYPQVDSLYHKGRYDEGIAGNWDQLSTFIHRYGQEHFEVSVSLINLALFFRAKGDLDTAASLVNEALSIRRRLYGDAHPEVAAAVNHLAIALMYKGYTDHAGSLFRKALSTHRRLLGDHDPQVTMCMNNLATLLHAKGDFRGAEPLLRKVLAIERGMAEADRTDYSTTLNNLAQVIMAQGDYFEAELVFREALALRRSLYGEDDLRVATSLSSLGGLLFAKGNLAGAERHFREALDKRRKLIGEDHGYVASTLDNLSVVLHDMGDWTGAEQCCREALAIRRRRLPKNDPQLAINMNNLATMLSAKKNFKEAESIHREALTLRQKLYGEDHPDVAVSMTNLATVLQWQGKHEEAEPLLRRARALCRRLLGEDYLRTAVCAHHLARLLKRKGEYPEAASLYREALSIREMWRTRIVGAERERAQHEDKLMLSHTAAELSQVLLRMGDAKEALCTAEEGRGRAFLDLLARADRDLVKECRGRGDEAFAERLDRLLERESSLRNTLSKAENTLYALRMRRDRNGEEGRKLISRHTETVHGLRRKLHDAEAAVTARLRDFWPDARPAAIEEIRSMLTTGEVVLYFTWTDYALTLIVVPSVGEGSVLGAVCIDGSENMRKFSARIDEIRKDIAGPPSSESIDETWDGLHELYMHLLGTLPSAMLETIEGARRIVVVPDGMIAEIPFEALVASRDGPSRVQCLLDEIPRVVYAESATVYVNRRKEKAGPKRWKSGPLSVLALGDPVFVRNGGGPNDRVRSDEWESEAESDAAEASALDRLRLHGGTLDELPGTAFEARAISSIVREAAGEPVLLLGENATVSALESAVESKRYVHLATHGLTGSRYRPYDAGLALSRPNVPTPEDFGFLTLDHIIRRWRGKLEECDMVVLSACDTQRGVKAGGGAMALPWGFMYAGAPTVVASLWKVDDIATALLMKRFYENLLGQYGEIRGGNEPKTRMEKADALREAKQWLRDLPLEAAVMSAARIRGGGTRGEIRMRAGTTVPKVPRPYAHPYYWAAFILMGDPE